MRIARADGDDDGDRDDGSAAQVAPDPWRHRYGPPDNEVPGVLPVGAVITRGDDAAVVLVGLRVHTTGLLLDVAVRRRLDPTPADPDPFGRAEPGLLLGVELADGGAATTLAGRHTAGDAAPDAPTLVHHGAHGGGRTYDLTCWLSPAPPAGDVVVVAAAPAWGIGEGAVTVPGDALAAAAASAQMLWPREPDRAWTPEELPPPEVPPGGWFARVLGGASTA